MTRALILVSLLTFAATASASQMQGDGSRVPSGQWIQLTLAGQIEEPGGARIEIEVGAVQGRDDFESRQVLLHPHLAQHTTAADVVSLLAQRLERAKFDLWLSDTRADDGRILRHLFIERALFVRLRLGHGLSSSVTVCEGAPASMRIEPPDVIEEGAQLLMTLSTVHPHTKQQRREELVMPLTFDMHPGKISEELTRRCLDRDWVAQRPHPDSWRLVKLSDGAAVAGFCVELNTTGDWRIELEFGR